MKRITETGMLLCGLLLLGCTDNSAPDEHEGLLDSQLQTMEKARQVEDILAESARQRAEQIEPKSEDGR